MIFGVRGFSVILIVTVFGGRQCYRHVFRKDKNVEGYNIKDIKKVIGLDRDAIIRLALLLGSDYTDGVIVQ